jgi:hypothetical protein
LTRLSLPREHGAWLTLAGAAFGGIWQATDRVGASGFAVALAAAFVARAPLERSRPARWDGALRLVCSLAIVGGSLVAGRNQQWLGLASALCAAVLIGASLLARKERQQRNLGFEALGMAALGASAGAIALVGAAPFEQSLILGFVLGTHAAVSVPLVRSELRPREREHAASATALATLALVAAVAILSVIGSGTAAVALVPRAVDLAIRHVTGWRLRRAALVGVRETVELAAALALLLLI